MEPAQPGCPKDRPSAGLRDTMQVTAAEEVHYGREVIQKRSIAPEGDFHRNHSAYQMQTVQ